ncbi:MAG: proton-conducting transporter membrane subunit [Rickettsiaceae bacterium]|nr:proton-conducting transporter membrane subunit [Rickettsiaceae bacterium]
MIYHPTLIILASVFALTLSYKKNRAFSVIALSMPIISAVFFYQLPDSGTIDLFSLSFIIEANSSIKLIGSAFILALFLANLYALGQDKKNEVILGSSYGAFAFLCLLAGDFLSMFIGLELMMIFSSIIIFIGGIRSSLRSAKKYFFTHLVSSNLIIIGITYLITENNNLEIVSITDLLNNAEDGFIPLLLMSLGLLINIAIFPFCGWMVSCYPKASPSGFLYLISFTTKVSIMLMIKLLSGCEMLQYVAIPMIMYASVKAMYEDNILSILCYLSIISMGLMLLAISNGSHAALLGVAAYLFIDIVYKLLLGISFVSLVDKTANYDCSNLKLIKSKILLGSISVGIIMMMNAPLTSSWYIKSSISLIFIDSPIYFLILFLNFMTILALPWKQYFSSKEHYNFTLNVYTKLGLIFAMIALGIIMVTRKYLPVFSEIEDFETIGIFSADTVKQIILILSAIYVAFHWKTKRTITKPINLMETIGNILFYIYNYCLNRQTQADPEGKEALAIETLEQQIKAKITLIHNQKTAIFVAITMFMVMLVALNISIPN